MQSLNEIRLDIVRSKMPYYVYILFGPDGKPFYVGKGKSDRIEAHEQEARSYLRNKRWKGINEYKVKVISEIWSKSQSVSYAIDSWHYDSLSAGNREREIIKEFGKIVNGTGILTNILDGGDYLTEEDRIKISNKVKQFCAENPEFIEHLQRTKDQWIKEHPEQYAEAERKRLEICATEEVRNAVSETLREYYKNNPEALQDMSERAKVQFGSEEAREENRRRAIENKSHESILRWLAEVDEETLAEKGRNHSEWMKEFYQTEDGKVKTAQAAEKRNAKFRTDRHRKHMSSKIKEYAKNNPEAWKLNRQKALETKAKKTEARQKNLMDVQEQLLAMGKTKIRLSHISNGQLYNWKKRGLVYVREDGIVCVS